MAKSDNGADSTQLTLFSVETFNEVATPAYDSYWDEIGGDRNRCNPSHLGEVPHKIEDDGQVTIFWDDSQEPPDPGDYPGIDAYEKAFIEWAQRYPELAPEISQEFREQPQTLDLPSAPEINHWVETYWVPRDGQKYWYYRYVSMSGRKLRHRHIPGGNVRSQLAQRRKEEIETAIANGEAAAAIEKLIRSWRSKVLSAESPVPLPQ